MTTEKENFVYEILNKIDNKQKLSKEEFERIISEYLIDSENIIKLQDRTFAISWSINRKPIRLF